MKTPAKISETNAFDLHNLSEEHAEISRRYTRLEKAIRLGRDLSRIVGAANSLVQIVLLHFTHEERFLEKLAVPSLDRQRDANIETTAQLFDIEAGLQQGKDASIPLLLNLAKVWMKEHMQRESGEFECEDPSKTDSPFCLSARSISATLPRASNFVKSASDKKSTSHQCLANVRRSLVLTVG